jgi:hypothetical protein
MPNCRRAAAWASPSNAVVATKRYIAGRLAAADAGRALRSPPEGNPVPTARAPVTPSPPAKVVGTTLPSKSAARNPLQCSAAGLLFVPQHCRPLRLLAPVRAHVDVVPLGAALFADDVLSKPRQFSVVRIFRYVDQARVPTLVAEAVDHELLHPKCAHVAERQRRAGWVLGAHCSD